MARARLWHRWHQRKWHQSKLQHREMYQLLTILRSPRMMLILRHLHARRQGQVEIAELLEFLILPDRRISVKVASYIQLCADARRQPTGYQPLVVSGRQVFFVRGIQGW